MLVDYNTLFNGQMEAWVAAGGPEQLVGETLEVSLCVCERERERRQVFCLLCLPSTY
jgi:hypothetical protein